jgi:molybdopterin-guanine dinucleotide biosynthesis protein
MPATSQSPIPAVLLQGFLGAGKTTLLRSLLVEARKRDLSMGLVVNDMSDLDVDGQVLVQTDIVDHDAAYFHSIHSCVLSSKRGIESLREALSSMRKKQPPDLVIVESSGSSHPLPLVEFFQAQRGFLLTGVLTLVDAAMIDEDYASSELIVDLFEELDGYAVGDGLLGSQGCSEDRRKPIREAQARAYGGLLGARESEIQRRCERSREDRDAVSQGHPVALRHRQGCKDAGRRGEAQP